MEVVAITLLALTLLVPRIRADDHGRAVPLDHAAALAHRLDGCSDLHNSSTFVETALSERGMTLRAHRKAPCGDASS
jgi:hypothetical protein